MAIHAIKDGDIISQDSINQILSLQSFQLIYQGAERDARVGAGVAENNLANYSYCAKFTLAGSTEIGRVELQLDRDGNGADLIVQIRSGMVPASGVDGTLLKEVVVPKEFITDSAVWWSVPVGLSGLTSGAQYWLAVVQQGDATHHVDWIGEAAQDGSYPAYRRNGPSGNWAANNALHFKVYSGASGDVAHGIYGSHAHTTILYDGEIISKVYRYLPPADGHEGGIREVQSYSWAGEYLVGGEVV
jgi:hypothetical protein